MSAGTSQYRPPPPTIRVTPAISVNTAVEALGLVRSSVRARSESGAGVDIQPHWPHKNQGDTGDDAENDQFQTECPIRLPRGRNENRSDKRDRKEDERPRRANA